MLVLSREQFRNGVFLRDDNKCVICKLPAVDAHHIVERRLFDNGGYYIDNGASLCSVHHIMAEQTILSCEDIRQCAGIKNIVLPSYMYSDTKYTKWGDVILDNGLRTKGELFHDESVQKALKDVLYLYTNHVKYPRTHHLPWSQNISDDDRIIESMRSFENEEVVITTKMDGENTNFYSDYIHARSLDYSSHQSRDRVKAIWASIAHDIPEGWRICGENLYAKHSIHYTNLVSYFLAFSIWNEKNECLSWEETIEWCKLLNVEPVPIVFRGPWDKALKFMEFYLIKGTGYIQNGEYPDDIEGYVLRVARSFSYGEFRKVVAKYVRKNHVTTHGHWMRDKVIPNELRSLRYGLLY